MPEQTETEAGATGPDFRHWLAAEAKRQGELRMAAQAVNISAMEARATSIVAWSTTAVVALITFGAQRHAIPLVVLPSICLLIASAACVASLWPGTWHPPGHDFASLAAMGYQSEMQMNEAAALSYETGIAANDTRAARSGRLLRFAWVWFSLAPIAALVGAMIVNA